MPKKGELFNVCDPFARVANIIDSLPSKPTDDVPLRDLLPGVWPTAGDIRKLRDAMKKLGWTSSYQRPRS